MVLSCFLTDQGIKEEFSKGTQSTRASSNMAMAPSMKGGGRMATHMGMEFLLFLTYQGMREIGTKASTMGKGLTCYLVEQDTKEIGSLVNTMVLVFSNGLTAAYTEDNGRIVGRMDMGNS